MNITREITYQAHSSVKLSLVISKDDVQNHYESLLKKYAGGIQIPGFRKGKAPTDVVERKVGAAVREEAVGEMMEKALENTFQAEDFPKEALPLAYTTPSVLPEIQKDKDSDLSFAVVYDVFPRVEIKNWKGFSIEVPQVKVEKEDIDRELEEIRERNSFVLDKEEGAKAQKGDVLTVSYAETDKDDNIIEGTEREDYVFTLGTGMNVFKFDDEVLGMKKGETKSFSKTFGDDADEELKGSTKNLQVTLKELKEKKVPELDDELAQDVHEKFATLADLEADIRKRLELNLERQMNSIKISRLLEKILEKIEIELPQSMVQMEMNNRWKQMGQQFGMDGEQVQKLFSAHAGADGEEGKSMEANMRVDVEKALRSRLIIETLMNDLELKASEEEVEALIERMAEEMSVSIEEIKNYYGGEHMREHLEEEVRERKLHELLFAENTVKKGKKVKYLDLMQNNV